MTLNSSRNAAIMEFDGGMTREEAERKAGEMIHKGPNV